MYLEHFGLKKEPFAEQVDPEIFYSEGEGTNILRAIYADLQEGEALVLLTGEVGSGKTMLCRLLAHLVPSSYKVVYLASPAGSFDELLQSFATELELEASPQDLGQALEHFQGQAKKPQKILLIIDAAEAMFPAALERLIRTVSSLGSDLIQLVLAGQVSLLETIKHLNTYCPDIPIPPCHHLPSLPDEDIGPYLQYRLSAAGLLAGPQMFSRGAVQRIAQQAQGDLHKVNRLADQALHQAWAVKAHPPLVAAHVANFQAGPVSADSPRSAAKESSLPRLLLSILLVAVALGLLFGSWKLWPWDQGEVEQQIAAPPSTREKDLSVGDKLQLIRKYEPRPAERVTQLPPPIAVEQQEEPPLAEEELPLVIEEEVEELIAAPPQQQEVIEASPPPEPEPATVEESPIIQLSPGMRKTRRGTGETGNTGPQATISTPKTLPEVQGLAAGQAASPEEPTAADLQQRFAPQAQNHNDADQLYQEMLLAGSRFRNTLYANKYTVNILTLYVDNAVEQVKSLIVQEEYRAHRQNMYILRKQTRPTALFVFYGIYDTLDQALEASNSLPAFIRRHNPYPLSITNALARASN